MQHISFRNLNICRVALRDTFRVAKRRPAVSAKAVHTVSQAHRNQSVLLLKTNSQKDNIRSKTPSTSRQYTFQTTGVVFPDPNRPDIYYHLVYAPTPISETHPAFAVSFLEEVPTTGDAASVIGWLPAQTSTSDPSQEMGPDQSTEGQSSLQDFRVNHKFLNILHETIKEGLRKDVDLFWIDSAVALQSGWMHIQDQRNIPALDRVGDPDDIIGTVLVQDSKILVDTYSPMPAYRVCTADGVMQLTDGLSQHLLRKLKELNKA